MEINLLRHGRPDIDRKERITAAEFHPWMERYDRSGVTDRPPQAAVSRSLQCHHIVCSDLLRSLQSADLLGVEADLVEPLFREAELPSFPFGGLKVAAGNFSMLARVAWLCGHSSDCEAYGAARCRAEEGADRLIELALSHQQVLLVGHGMMNWLIGRVLKKQHWRSLRSARANQYWGLSSYYCAAPVSPQ
jgi:broad specificity phosphatase PhoE